MFDEANLNVLEEVKEYLHDALSELSKYKKHFSSYIDALEDIVDELERDIEPLEEEQNKIWADEIKEANREYWATQF